MHIDVTVGRIRPFAKAVVWPKLRKEEHVCPKFAGAHGSQACRICQVKSQISLASGEARLPRLQPEHRAACHNDEGNEEFRNRSTEPRWKPWQAGTEEDGASDEAI